MPFRSLTRLAQAYMLGLISLGLACLLYALSGLRATGDQWWLWPLLAVMAAAAQWMSGVSPRAVHFDAAPAFFFASMVILPAGWLALLVAFAYLPSLLWPRTPRYLTLANISSHLLAALGGQQLLQLIGGQTISLTSAQSVVALVSAAITYLLVNHASVALGLKAMRGIALLGSPALQIGNLFLDLYLLCMGAILAIIWNINPILTLIGIAPFALAYRAAMIPGLEEEARIDAKTGLYNANYLTRAMDEELNRARQAEQTLGLLLADLDGLRKVNNTYGHVTGDLVLAGVGGIIRDVIQRIGTPARFGGEEFAVVLPGMDLQEASMIAEQIRAAVAAATFRSDDGLHLVQVTITIGVAKFPRDGEDRSTLLRAADRALYAGKTAGRDRVVTTDQVAGMPLAAQEAMMRPDETRSPHMLPSASPQPCVQVSRPAGRGAQPLLIAVLAFSVVALATNAFPALHMAIPNLLLLIGLTALTEGLSLEANLVNTLPAANSVLVGTAFVFGSPGVAVAAPLLMLARVVRRRDLDRHILYDLGVTTLAGVATAEVFSRLSHVTAIHDPLDLLLPGLAAVLTFDLVSVPLRLAWLLLDGQETLRLVWTRASRDLVTHTLVIACAATAMAIGYIRLGPSGLLIFVTPLLVMRYLQQYASHRDQTKIEALKGLNEQLLEANHDLGSINEELLYTIANLADQYDSQVADHSRQVARYAVVIGQELNLHFSQIEIIRQAALCHEIGRVMPADPRLDQEARNRAGLIAASTLLARAEHLKALTPALRSQYERYDGRGYPDGLIGEQIPMEARVLSLADYVARYVDAHPARHSALGRDLVEELSADANQRFDSRVVKALMNILEREGDSFLLGTPSMAAGRAIISQPVETSPAVGWFAQALAGQSALHKRSLG